MNKEAWLQLSDYSNKYKVSVSTLRRRIKADEIEFQFEDGKYWLPDRAIEKYARNRSAATPKAKVKVPEIEFPVSAEVTVADVSKNHDSNSDRYVTREEIFELTNSMITELKSAYVLILQEKEEAILDCKREIADLKTLCHTLESENEKLKAETHAPLSGWFVDDDSEVEL